MSKIIKAILVIIFLSAVSSLPMAFADSTGTITGKVTNSTTGLPPLDAKVTIVELNREVPVYPYGGKYLIQDVPPGFYSLKIECDYYATDSIDCIEILPNSWNMLNLALQPGHEYLPIFYESFPIFEYGNDGSTIHMRRRQKNSGIFNNIGKFIEAYAR